MTEKIQIIGRIPTVYSLMGAETPEDVERLKEQLPGIMKTAKRITVETNKRNEREAWRNICDNRGEH